MYILPTEYSYVFDIPLKIYKVKFPEHNRFVFVIDRTLVFNEVGSEFLNIIHTKITGFMDFIQRQEF
jgi:hypothetical protein